jgi:hypothetical protein
MIREVITFYLPQVQHRRRAPRAFRIDRAQLNGGVMPSTSDCDLGESVNRRLLRAIGWVALCLAAMALVAYAFGRVTRTEWVWWLAPLTVALDGSLLFRAGVRGGAALLSLSELRMFRDLGAPIYLGASGVAAGVAAWGAYTGNRLALIVGAAVAILGRAFEHGEEPAFERNDEPA